VFIQIRYVTALHRLPRVAINPLSISGRNRRQIWLGSAGIGSWGGDLNGAWSQNSNKRAIDLRDMPPGHHRLPSSLFLAFSRLLRLADGLTPYPSRLSLRYALSRIHGNLNLKNVDSDTGPIRCSKTRLWTGGGGFDAMAPASNTMTRPDMHTVCTYIYCTAMHVALPVPCPSCMLPQAV
jgi:hypothetical protein